MCERDSNWLTKPHIRRCNETNEEFDQTFCELERNDNTHTKTFCLKSERDSAIRTAHRQLRPTHQHLSTTSTTLVLKLINHF